MRFFAHCALLLMAGVGSASAATTYMSEDYLCINPFAGGGAAYHGYYTTNSSPTLVNIGLVTDNENSTAPGIVVHGGTGWTTLGSDPRLAFGFRNYNPAGGSRRLLGATIMGEITSTSVGGEGMHLVFSTKPSSPANTPYQRRMQINSDGKVCIGSTQPNDVNALLTVNGQINAKKVVVTLSGTWADYVFDDGYRLRPLDEVKSFVAEHRHLPDLPAAAAVERDGVDTADMLKRHMQKIEELTLYAIDVDARVRQQQEVIDAQAAVIAKQQALLERLERKLDAAR